MFHIRVFWDDGLVRQQRKEAAAESTRSLQCLLVGNLVLVGGVYGSDNSLEAGVRRLLLPCCWGDPLYSEWLW